MEKPEPMGRAELDTENCDNPNCKQPHDELWLSSQCHPGHPMQAKYRKDTGIMTLICNVCQREAGQIIVGDRRKN